MHTPEPWTWRNVPSAGVRIEGRLPEIMNKGFVEFTLKHSVPQIVFELPTPGMSPRWEVEIIREPDEPPFVLGYEPWIQFPNDEWNKMMEANAERIIACVNACAGMIDPEKEITALRNLNLPGTSTC